LAFLAKHRVRAEFVAPGVPMPTVASAAAAIGVPEEQILKTLLFVGEDERYVVAIANGTRKIARSLLAEASGIARPRAADPGAVLAVTGFPAGGVSPIALAAGIPVIVDEAVPPLPVVYGGGGAEHLLLRLDPADIVRLNGATVASIVERR
jgi:Cys-tRNA(Pro)/Cys-tRNA(Cys) deacylase